MTPLSARVCRFYVWGSNADGALATTSHVGDDVLSPRPSNIYPLAPLDGGMDFACQTGDAIYCWGSNGYGRLGRGSSFTDAYSAEPVAVTGLSGTPLSMGVGSTHACAVVQAGGTTAHCWGANASGQLGNGTVVDAASPVQVADPSSGAYATIYAGQTHSCAVTNAGVMWCWGSDAWGQLAQDDSIVSTATPSTITPPADDPDATWLLAATGARNTCGSADTGVVYCWGAADLGTNGNGNLVDNQYAPVAAYTSGPLIKLLLKTNSVVLVTSTQAVYGWGDNASGQLNASPVTDPIVTSARTMAPFASGVSVGADFTCIFVTMGPQNVCGCVGNNANGQLGDGSRISASTPVAVPSAPGQYWTGIYSGYSSSYGTQGPAS